MVIVKNISAHINVIIIMTIFVFAFSPQTIIAQSKKAFLVGISNYESSDSEDAWPTIHGCNDVELISATLKSQGFKTQILKDKQATANKIRKELKSFSSSLHAGDMVYLHFSCHGQPFEDLAPFDEEDGWDESLIPYDAKMAFSEDSYDGANHLLDDELYKYFSTIRKSIGPDGFLCVVIDACHAGGSSRGNESEDDGVFVRGTNKGFSSTGKAYRPRIDTNGHFNIPSSPELAHVVILEACRSYQSNYEIKEEGVYYGPLSYYVNQVFQKQIQMDNIHWVQEVKKLMDADIRLVRQDLVYETSLE